MGNYSALSLKAARIVATAAGAKVDAGVDVASEKQRSGREIAVNKSRWV